MHYILDIWVLDLLLVEWGPLIKGLFVINSGLSNGGPLNWGLVPPNFGVLGRDLGDWSEVVCSNSGVSAGNPLSSFNDTWFMEGGWKKLLNFSGGVPGGVSDGLDTLEVFNSCCSLVSVEGAFNSGFSAARRFLLRGWLVINATMDTKRGNTWQKH